jgi:hypothetical protein
MLIFERLDTSCHNRGDFDCGVVALNEYLQNTAHQHIAKGTSNTFILTQEDVRTEIIGYFTLVFSQIEPSIIPPHIVKKLPKHLLPVALLGRLAVDLRHSGKSYGVIMVVEAAKRVLHAAENAGGLVGMRVDAKSERLKVFYERLNFIPIPDSMSLFMPMSTIKQTV